MNGVETLCYVIKTNSRATEHKMGRWCPSHIEDGMEKAGIWFKDGKAYDVSGHFIASLDEFYNDAQWKLYREDGTIKVTDTEEGCLAAAKPNVEEEYHNHCVECLPDFFKGQVTTFVIPATPQYLNRVSSERKYETKSYFLDFQYACIRILRQFNGVFIKCSVF